MRVRVPCLPEKSIEGDAENLLSEYEREKGIRLELPIPIDDIVEKYLKLGIEFDDTHKRFGVPRSEGYLDPDILGAIYFDERRIVIDESLDPEERPEFEGRYRFTLAHEGGGHWRLHRDLFRRDPNQGRLFGEPDEPSVICRTNQKRAPEEWQADFYASCLLMPNQLVRNAWQAHFGDSNRRFLKNAMPQGPDTSGASDTEVVQAMNEAGRLVDDGRWEEIVRPIADRCKVSPIAMRIRLEKLGLIIRDNQQRNLATGPK
jgi:Zn-dependent peptidase ImmA (M78 family)